MISDSGDFKISGNVTGPDGEGNAFRPFTSLSEQIIIEPDLWRRAERNATGDRFSFDVKRSIVKEVSFQGTAGERFVTRLAQLLSNEKHTVELISKVPGKANIEAFEVFEPPLKSSKGSPKSNRRIAIRLAGCEAQGKRIALRKFEFIGLCHRRSGGF